MTLNYAYIGARFGKLKVIGNVKPTTRGDVRKLCKCDCGTEHTARRSWLISGRVKACRGCSK